MVDTDLFAHLGNAISNFIESHYSGVSVVSTTGDPTQEIKWEQNIENKKSTDAILMARKEHIVFFDYMFMFMHLGDTKFREKPTNEWLDNIMNSNDAYEFIKFLKSIINDMETFNHLKESKEDFEIRFFNIGNVVTIPQISSKLKGRLVTLRGEVFYRWDEIRQFVTQRKWICVECGSQKIQFVKRGEKLKKIKGICNHPIGDGEDRFVCRSTRFTHIEDIKYEDLFRMKIEALPQDTPKKIQPPTYTIEFTHNMCHENLLNNVTIGTAYEFTGFIRMSETKLSSGEVIFKTYMEVMSYRQIEKRERKIEVTPEERKQIKDFLSKSDAIEKLVTIFGKRVIGFKREKKLFIVLKTLQESFNKLEKEKRAKDYLMHLLLVGDFATGKSEVVEVFQDICENSQYIIGSSTTDVGLTGITERDEMTGHFSIQAGILARTSGDTLIVEEFDKKENKAEFGVLNEAMTKYEYTVTKAGKHRTFRCNTTIVIVANPIGKKFDLTQSLIPQIDIEGDLLSRFTVISAIFDKGDIEMEQQINKILLERGGKILFQEDKKNAEYIKKCIRVASSYDPQMNVKELKNFIDNFTQEAMSLKKSLVYEKDIKFWENYGNRRNRESLIKIIKGIAMLHCHEKPTDEDMKEGLHLFRMFMKDLVDYNVLLDPEEIATGKPKSIAEKIESRMKAEELIMDFEEKKESKKGQLELFLERVVHVQENSESTMADVTELEEWSKKNLNWSTFKFNEMIEKLSKNGDIYEPRKGFIQRLK